MPALQGVHVADTPGLVPPDVEKDPAGHALVQVATVLPPRPYLPALHGEHVAAPTALQNPGGHTVQPDDGTGAGGEPHPALVVQGVVPTSGPPA